MRLACVADAVVFLRAGPREGMKRAVRGTLPRPILCESVFCTSQSTPHPFVHRALRVPNGFLCKIESACVPGSWRHLKHFLVSCMSDILDLFFAWGSVLIRNPNLTMPPPGGTRFLKSFPKVENMLVSSL